jgi:hypothetical protein
MDLVMVELQLIMLGKVAAVKLATKPSIIGSNL